MILLLSERLQEQRYLSSKHAYLSSEEIHAFLFLNMAHYQFVNEIQPTQRHLVVVWLDNLMWFRFGCFA